MALEKSALEAMTIPPRSPHYLWRFLKIQRYWQGSIGTGRVWSASTSKSFFKHFGWLDDNDIASIEDEERVAVLHAMEAAEVRPDPKLDSMFTDVYHEKPPHLIRQEEELRRDTWRSTASLISEGIVECEFNRECDGYQREEFSRLVVNTFKLNAVLHLYPIFSYEI